MRKSITLLLLLLGLGIGVNVLPGQNPFAFTEIMYRSPASPDSLEFIEFQNRGNFLEDMDQMYFSAGVVYTFPSRLIPGGAFVIVCKDTTAFKNVFGPHPNLFQWTSGDLDDNGEFLELRRFSSPVAQITYSNTSPWPIAANGLHPGSRRGSFTAGMPAANHNHIKSACHAHLFLEMAMIAGP